MTIRVSYKENLNTGVHRWTEDKEVVGAIGIATIIGNLKTEASQNNAEITQILIEVSA